MNSECQISWASARGQNGAGSGNWKFFPKEEVPRVLEAAEVWKQQLAGVDKPWLCWCVEEEWCWYQQQLVAAVGWTPVVGTDGRHDRPRIHESALFIDFNAQLKLPLMWMHFPVEFAHRFCPQLAFWHSDVLIPVSVLEKAARQFESISPGETIAVDMTRVGLGTALKRYWKGRQPFFRRYFEVLACTTAAASQSQYETGCSWWRHPGLHPNFRSDVISGRPHFDHGVGIWLWKKYFSGDVRPVEINVHPYHYSTNHPRYDRRRDERGKPVGSKHDEMNRSFDLADIVAGLELPEGPAAG